MRDSEIIRAASSADLTAKISLGPGRLGFFLFPGELFQAALRCGLGVLESVFLSPIDDSRRTDPLNDPVEYLGVVARIEQNVCDVPAKS
jgi:hypothetical protein